MLTVEFHNPDYRVNNLKYEIECGSIFIEPNFVVYIQQATKNTEELQRDYPLLNIERSGTKHKFTLTRDMFIYPPSNL